MEVEDHRRLMIEAIERDRDGQRALFAGEPGRAAAQFAEASELYRRSWESAPPASYGRLVGMLKSAVLAGQGPDQAAYALAAIGDEGGESPPAAYVRTLASLIQGDDDQALRCSERMRGGGEAFARTADAIDALARHDAARYAAAAAGIVRDFEHRTEHLTGVPIADTALMLQVLAGQRGVAAPVSSPVLPAPQRA